MGFSRQLDALAATLGALAIFLACIILIGIPIRVSLLIAACVFVGGLSFGRRFVEAVIDIFK